MHRRLLCSVVAALACSAPAAQPGDPLASGGCLRALDALQAQEAAAAAGDRPEARERPRTLVGLLRARRQAALACLGSRADAPAGRPTPAQEPVVVAPVRDLAPLLLPPGPALPQAASPRGPQPFPMVTTCDAVACWTSDGSRLPRTGAGLVGPRGPCTGVPGTPLQCP